jgi:regulator of RNase E activity RraB
MLDSSARCFESTSEVELMGDVVDDQVDQHTAVSVRSSVVMWGVQVLVPMSSQTSNASNRHNNIDNRVLL